MMSIKQNRTKNMEGFRESLAAIIINNVLALITGSAGNVMTDPILNHLLVHHGSSVARARCCMKSNVPLVHFLPG